MCKKGKLQKLWDAQNGLCIFCKKETWMPEPGQNKPVTPQGWRRARRASIEHKVPSSQGGTNRAENLAMSCVGCNYQRGVLDYDLFMRIKTDKVFAKEYHRNLQMGFMEKAIEKKITKAPKREAFIMKIAWAVLVLKKYSEGQKSG